MRFALRALPAAFLLMAACAPRSESPITPFLKDLNVRQAAVFVFLAPDCPVSQSYSATLSDLHAQFQTRDIQFYGVFAGRAAEGAKEFVATYGIPFPILPDADFRISDFLEATTTPQAFVLDREGRTLYSGAIDNRAPELGQRRTVITENYLLDALKSVVEGRDVRLPRTRPVGCFIERKLPSSAEAAEEGWPRHARNIASRFF